MNGQVALQVRGVLHILTRCAALALLLTVVAGLWAAGAAAYNLPATGQKSCYQSGFDAVACAEPGEEYFGEDGYYQAGRALSYASGTTTVTDNVTGLVWQKELPSSGGMDREAGVAYCPETYGPNWRLPTRTELLTIVDAGQWQPACNAAFGYESTAEGLTQVPYAGNSVLTWIVRFNEGSTYTHDAASVRCVRGAFSESGYTDNADGTITDNSTGLMWQTAGSTVSMIWKEALRWCEDATTGGYTDWRLPNKKELESIVDVTRIDPAINTDYFEETSGVFRHWTSTTNIAWRFPDTSLAWVVFLQQSGVTETLDKIDSVYGRARCVRGGVSSLVEAVLSGVPASPTMRRQATITVGGTDVVAYRYRFDGSDWSAERPIATPIAVSALALGQHTLSVVGKNSQDLWQSTDTPTTAQWTVVNPPSLAPEYLLLLGP